ncbi:hypothetical protein CR513_29144, partial [Mucuna pruriens]
MSGSIVDNVYIFDDFTDLDHNNITENHNVVPRSIFEDGVYIFDSIVFSHNMENNVTSLRSIEDGHYIFDSVDSTHNHNMENNGETSRVEPANQESIQNLEMVTSQEEMDQSSDS